MKMRKAIGGLSLLVGAVLLLGSGGAYAAGTAAGTKVTNSVSLDFQVHGTAQTQQTASVDFKVDDKLVISVANQDSGDITTNTEPGSQKAVSAFQVTNDGNAQQDVILSAVNMPTGTTDPKNTSASSDLLVTTSGVYSDSTCQTPISTISNMAVGAQQIVYICSSIPKSATNNQIAVVGLLAKVGAAGSGTAYASDDKSLNKNTTGTNGNITKELNIFAEAASAHPATGDSGADDGASSDLGAYKVQAASLAITKSVAVTKDPTNDSNPHAIPGATLEYTVTIDNAPGAQSATSLDVKDTIPSNLTYIPGTINVQLQSASNGSPCADSSGTVTSGSDTATCNFNTSTKQIEVNGFSVDASKQVIITYDATIN